MTRIELTVSLGKFALGNRRAVLRSVGSGSDRLLAVVHLCLGHAWGTASVAPAWKTQPAAPYQGMESGLSRLSIVTGALYGGLAVAMQRPGPRLHCSRLGAGLIGAVLPLGS